MFPIPSTLKKKPGLQLIVGIPIGKNYAPTLADIFLYSNEVENIHCRSLLSMGKKNTAY